MQAGNSLYSMAYYTKEQNLWQEKQTTTFHYRETCRIISALQCKNYINGINVWNMRSTDRKSKLHFADN